MASVRELEIDRAQKARKLLNVAAKNGTLPKAFMAIVKRVVELNQQVVKKGSSRELEKVLSNACDKLKDMQSNLLLFNAELCAALSSYYEACIELQMPTGGLPVDETPISAPKKRR